MTAWVGRGAGVQGAGLAFCLAMPSYGALLELRPTAETTVMSYQHLSSWLSLLHRYLHMCTHLCKLL